MKGNSMDFDFKKAQKEKDAVDRLLRKMSESNVDISVLREYVLQELPQVALGNRIDMRSMLHSGKMAIVAMLISQERLRSEIRWGDLMERLNEEVVLGFPPKPARMVGYLDQIPPQD